MTQKQGLKKLKTFETIKRNFTIQIKIRFLFVFLFFSLFPLNLLYSYNDIDTHPDLTVEIVKLYNLQSSENKLTNEEMELLRQGSILEDTAPRWINHFYNPETGEGWTAKNLEGVSQKNMQTVSDWFFSFEPPVSSLNWARNQELQNKYSLYQGNHTFQKAVYDYATGNKEDGLKSLGYILHLIEDASVPDHTRDDTHADISSIIDNADEGSPYEDWAEDYTKNNTLTIAETLNNQNRKYYKCASFDDCLIDLAKYSHYNFFSEDTIFEFDSPKIFREEKLNDKNYYYNENENILAKSYEIEDNKIYTLRDPLIMSSYFSLLSSESVLTGAGVIEVFFKEVHKAKNDPQYLESLKFKGKQMTMAQNAFLPAFFLFADKVISPFGEYARWEGILNDVTGIAKFVVSTLKSFVNPQDAQQAGLPVLDMDKGSKDEKTEERQQSKTIETQNNAQKQKTENKNSQTAAESLPESVPPNPRNAQFGERKKSPRKSILEPKVLGETVSRARLANSAYLPQANSLTGYVPGFGGGGTAIISSANNGNDQFPISNFKTNSNDQNQNSGTSTDNAASTNQDNNQGNNASTTENGNNSGNQNQQNGDNNTASSTNATSTETQTADTTAPPPPIITSPENLNQTFTSQTLQFQGTAEPSSILLAKSDFTSESTTTVSESGNWSLVLFLNQGTTTLLRQGYEGQVTIYFYAKDSAGNVSSSTLAEIFIDSLAPQIASFSVLECGLSSVALAKEDCLIATTTINLAWSSDASDLDYFELTWNSESEGSTTLLRLSYEGQASTTLTLTEGEHTLSLRVKDKAGNFSNSQTLTLEINLKPIVINEVAWMGTQANPNEEWLELYNRTNKTINLDNFVLRSHTNKPYIPLKNSIASRAFYLMERKDDEVIDIPADLLYGNGGPNFSLNNSGENLYLEYVANRATTTVDKVLVCGVFGAWCGGEPGAKITMERYFPDNPYWGSNLQVIRNGESSKGNPIFGTPKARNSLNYLIIPPNETTITQNTTLTKDKSPYYIHYTITVPKGKTLTIEPGTVIKTRGGGEYYLNIAGELKAEGTENEEIVFTSFYDDEYGGDLNNDGAQIVPVPGSWTKVLFTESSSSTINHARFRYGGRYYGFCCQGMMKIDRATSTITNSIFEYSYTYGLELISSNSRIENNTFQNNNNYPEFQNPAGLSVGGDGVPQIINNAFQNNYYGLYISGVSEAKIEDNTFSGNSGKAIYVMGAGGIGSFKNNSGTLAGGVSDGIYVSDLRLLTNATTTLYSNSLPYIFHNNPTISVQASLIVEPNVLIKNSNNNRIEVYGALVTKGQNPGDIVFTSLSDPLEDYWFGISANPGSRVSLTGTTIKYGGRILSWGAREKEAALYADNADIIVDNSLFYGNYKNGVMVVNSRSDIKNSEFKNHTKPDIDSRGLAYYDSTINLNNVAFRNNYFGLYADPLSLLGTIVEPLIFEGNASTSNVWLP